jgi:anti-sigma B factor antagonist
VPGDSHPARGAGTPGNGLVVIGDLDKGLDTGIVPPQSQCPGEERAGASVRVPFTLDVQSRGNAVVLLAGGEIDHLTGPRLLSAAIAALGAEPPSLVIDLAGVTFLDSGGIRALVTIRQHAEAARVALRLHLPGRRLAALLDVVGLAGTFDTGTFDTGAPGDPDGPRA